MALRDRPVDANRLGDPTAVHSARCHIEIEKLHRPLRSRQHDNRALVSADLVVTPNAYARAVYQNHRVFGAGP